MQVKTITTVAGVNEIDFGNDSNQSTAHFYWLKNLGDSTLYVSANPDPMAEKDDVAELPAKGAVSVETDEGKIYVLGAGKVEIHRTNSKFCPFDWQSSGSGGGGGGSITVDSELSDTSTNPLQNKVTTAAIKEVNSTVETLEAALENKSDINHTHDISASGNPIIMNNLQGGVPFSEITVSGKNLIPCPYAETTKTVNGITFTDNGDGTITANGTATANATFLIDNNFGFEKEGNYFLSGCPSGGGLNSFYINWFQNHTGVTIKNYNDYGSGIIIPYQHIFSENNSLAIAIIAGTTVNNLVFRPQIELGSTATEYEPPIMGRELTVSVCGKNLLPAMSNSTTWRGVTYTVNADGTITLNGTVEKTGSGVNVVNKIPLKAGVYTLSGCPEGGSETTFALRVGLGTTNTLYGRDYGNGLKITAETDTVITVIIQSLGGIVFDNVVFRPQLELGDTATAYEPYHGSTTTITPDSNPYTISNDIRQQEGLNIVSVSEGEISVTGVRKYKAIKRIWDEFASTVREISNLGFKINALDNITSSSIEANAQEIEAVRNTLSSTRDSLVLVTADVASNAQRIGELDTTVNATLNNEIEMLKAENQALYAEIEGLRALIKTT